MHTELENILSEKLAYYFYYSQFCIKYRVLSVEY